MNNCIFQQKLWVKYWITINVKNCKNYTMNYMHMLTQGVWKLVNSLITIWHIVTRVFDRCEIHWPSQENIWSLEVFWYNQTIWCQSDGGWCLEKSLDVSSFHLGQDSAVGKEGRGRFFFLTWLQSNISNTLTFIFMLHLDKYSSLI